MISEITFNLRLTADRIVAENHPVASNVEGQFCTALRQQYSWFSKRMSVTQLVEHVCIRRGYFGHNNLSLLNLSLNILKDHAGYCLFVYTEYLESYCFGLLLNDFAVESVIRFAKLHYHKRPRFAAQDPKIGEQDLLIASRYQAGLSPFERVREKVLQHGHTIH